MPPTMLEAPQSRTKFSDDWDEFEYCFEQAQYWFDGRRDRERATPFCDRIGILLEQIPEAFAAIIPNEAMALVGECRGDWGAAIQFRCVEIELIERLWRAASQAPPSERAEMLQGYDAEELADRHERLAAAYVYGGRLQEGIAALADAEELCFAHHLEFDAGEVRSLIFKELQARD